MKIIGFLIVFSQSFFALSHELVTRVIDTNAGHASITSIPDGHYMIFDAGRYSHRTHIVKQIKEVVIGNTIDLMVISHTDGDHLGAVEDILKNYRVKTILRLGWERCRELSQSRCPWFVANQAIKASVDAGFTTDLNLTTLNQNYVGKTFQLGKATATVLSAFPIPPDSWGMTQNSSDWRNAGSIVLRLEYAGRSILFTGDSWGRNGDRASDVKHGGAEKFMVDNAKLRPLKSDVIIAPHHGADDASSLEFVKTVSPSWVIFPSGGSYQHPRLSTVQRYIDAGVTEDRMFRTDLCDTPGSKEWRGRVVENVDDSGEDDDIDITISESGIVKVGYVSLDIYGC